MHVSEIQSRLATAGLYGGAVDGKHGPQTARAIEALFLARPYCAGDWRSWPDDRRLVAAGQILALLDGLDVGPIDGRTGPQTRYAFEVMAVRSRGLEGVETWRDDGDDPWAGIVRRSPWPHQRQREMERFFGAVGANQTTLVVPRGYPLCLAWETTKPVSGFICHEKIHDSVLRVLTRVLDAYGPQQIRALGLDRFGGCLNVRRVRGGSAWSTHAWGAALDFDPERNRLEWTRARAQFARPEYERWWSFWEEEGFISLGRARDFDWMHVQAAKL